MPLRRSVAPRAGAWIETGTWDTRCPSRYTLADVLLLAHTDALHGTLSGHATKKLMERAWSLYGDGRYKRLACDLGGAPVQPASA